jgi:hypothetical protein
VTVSDYTDTVLAKFPDVPAAGRKALADALAAAEKAQPGTKPGEANDDGVAGGSGPLSGAKAAEDPQTYAAARPDVQLAEAVAGIRAAEGVDYAAAERLALERDPALAIRYHGRAGDRERSRGAKVEPPRGMKLCECRPDVELAERAKARAADEGTSYTDAEACVLAENPKLASRLRDYRLGDSALDELSYRAATIRAANGGRMTPAKATHAALHEDPALRSRVMAHFEPKPYQPAS